MNRQWSVFAALVACLGLMIAASSCGDDDDSADRLTTATELADAWILGWSNSDPEAVASVFTEDGVYVYEDRTYQGRDQNADHVEQRGSQIENGVRVEEVSELDDGRYAWVFEWDAHGERYSGTLAVELEGDLAARITWVRGPLQIG